MSKIILELQNVTKEYHQAAEKLLILDNVNLELKRGEIVGLVGPSGAGKSTLLQIAGLLDQPSSGIIKIDNIDYSSANDARRTFARRELIGFVYQFHHLLREFTVFENIMIPQLISGVRKEVARDKVFYIVEKLKLTNRIHHTPSELSGGEQQRVAIGRALVKHPKILLADEPTGNLDVNTANQIFDILINSVKDLGLACLIVTHNLELAKKMDYILLLEQGKLLHVNLDR